MKVNKNPQVAAVAAASGRLLVCMAVAVGCRGPAAKVCDHGL